MSNMGHVAKILLLAKGAHTQANGDSPRHKGAPRTADVIVGASGGVASNCLSL